MDLALHNTSFIVVYCQEIPKWCDGAKQGEMVVEVCKKLWESPVRKGCEGRWKIFTNELNRFIAITAASDSWCLSVNQVCSIAQRANAEQRLTMVAHIIC